MKISVIITTYNKPEYLGLVLLGYHAQIDRNFEIVIADDGSTGETAAVIEEFSKSSDIPVLRVWHEDKGFRKTVILNKAIGQARGDYLIFTDGDLIPRNDMVSVHRANARRGHYIAGAYNRLPAKTTKAITRADVSKQNVFNIFWLMAHGYFPTRGFLRIVIPKFLGPVFDLRGEAGKGRFPGGNASCFKSDATAVGGFDERMTYGCEDREFGTRLCNSGLKPLRVKHSTFLMHMEHPRPYNDDAEIARNMLILKETEKTNRIMAGHLKGAA